VKAEEGEKDPRRGFILGQKGRGKKDSLLTLEREKRGKRDSHCLEHRRAY